MLRWRIISSIQHSTVDAHLGKYTWKPSTNLYEMYVLAVKLKGIGSPVAFMGRNGTIL